MKYLNTKTGNAIESDCVLCGGNWVKLEEMKKKQSQKEQKKTRPKTKKGDGK